MDADSNSFVSGAYEAVFWCLHPRRRIRQTQKRFPGCLGLRLLDETEQTQLNQELADIYDEYGYDAVLLISPDIGEEEDYRQYAAEFMQENDIVMVIRMRECVFFITDTRNITIVFLRRHTEGFLNECAG